MKKKVVFFGSHEIALPLLDYLLSSDSVELSGIVSQRDKPTGRGNKVTPTVISEFAIKNGIPLLTPDKPDDSTIEWMRSLGCEIIFVMAYGHILKSDLLRFPKLGIFNFHASILPKYRGASPIESAIASGESVTGVSLMKIVEEMDAGDVVDVEKVTINHDDTYKEVSKKISLACLPLIERNLSKICSGDVVGTPQNHSLATFARKLSKADGALDFNHPAVALKNRINAFFSHIGSFIDYEGTILKVGHACAEPSNSANHKCGEILYVGDNLKIATADGNLLIYNLQRPGGRMLPVRDFCNGFNLKVGTIITSHDMTTLVRNSRN